MDVIYTDLKAAFEQVNHRLLLAKLARLGFSTPLVEWFEFYLTNHRYRVKVESMTSREFVNCSGVPQGSNLGHLLFSLFFNDITTVVRESECLWYADDLRLFLPVRCFSDCFVLQASIDSFSDW